MSKVMQSNQELRNHLEEQFRFLIQSSICYDRGFDGEAKRLAHIMRTLLYDTSKSTSLLKQLGLKNIEFCCTCRGDYSEKIHIASFHCLVSVFMGRPVISKYVANLECSPGNTRWVSFQQWWNKIVIVDSRRSKFTRQRLIRTVCNKDGGSHVDPELDKEYFELSRKNSLGWKFLYEGAWFDISGPELASIREMAHEIIKTLIRKLPELERSVDSVTLREVMNPKRDLPGDLINEIIIDIGENKSSVDKYIKNHK